MSGRAVVPLLLLLALTTCVRNPATGQRQLSLISKQEEVSLGKQGAQDVRQSVGLLKDPRAQEYVAGVGLPMARRSERPELPWSIEVVDDPAVNAFALPGGPVFVTRGILTHLNSEAELASVLGHEIAHITARHSVNQLSQAQLAQVGLVLGSVLSEDIARFGGLATVGLQLLFLKHGRDDEAQADELGFRYLLEGGYDVREMANVFVTLDRVSKAAGAGRLPTWLATHPDPANRVQVARERAAKVSIPPNAKVGRDAYLAVLQGMPYGTNPRQGYFQGPVFLHPDLKLQLTFPEGWQTANQPQAVLAASPREDALVALATAGMPAPEALKAFVSQQGLQVADTAPAGYPPGTVLFQARTEQGVLQGVTTFLTHGGATLQLLGYTTPEAFSTYDGAFRSTFASFRELTDPAALAVQPARIELVKLTEAMTAQQFAQRYPSTVPPEEVALINGVEPGDTLPAGQTVKRVTGGVPKSP